MPRASNDTWINSPLNRVMRQQNPSRRHLMNGKKRDEGKGVGLGRRFSNFLKHVFKDFGYSISGNSSNKNGLGKIFGGL